MSNILERKAIALNGLIIVCSCVLGAVEATRPWGIGITIFMGAGLIFSGWANFCGWHRILAPRPSKPISQASFWTGGQDNHLKGVDDHYNSQIDEATNRADQSVTEVEKKQHLEKVAALRAEHRQMLEEAKHAVY